MATHYIFANKDKQFAIDKINELDCSKKWAVKIERCTRSVEQNNLFHMWMTEISRGYYEATGDKKSPGIWKIYFKDKFLGEWTYPVMGELVTEVRKTRSLPKNEMCQLLDDVQNYVGSEMSQFNIVLTQPEWR